MEMHIVEAFTAFSIPVKKNKKKSEAKLKQTKYTYK